MPRVLLLTLVALAACAKAAPPPLPHSPCGVRSFEGSEFEICSEPAAAIEIRTAGRSGQPLRSFAALQTELGARSRQVSFAMNAGMFDERGRAIGLLIENGRQLHAINLRKGGGNFHLLPNGVFLVRQSGKAEVVPSTRYAAAPDTNFATQSGPMLVIDGKLHPKFDPDGLSQYIRNGVGIAPDGRAVFVISRDPVSFGKFARFFRDNVRARNALYFDGSVSSLWDPANGRMDSHSELGPMVVVFKGAATAPGRADRARP